jgi:hypothetical protein
VEPVNRLHRSGRVLQGRVRQRALRDVHYEPEAVGDIVVECAFHLEDEPITDRILIQVLRIALHLEERCPCRNEFAKSRHELERAVSPAGFLHELVVADLGNDARPSCPDEAG